MFSINMRLFTSTLLLLLTFFSSQIGCVPLHESTTASSTSLSPSIRSDDHYDQRQNGTDNFRIHIDGVVVVFAPVEAFKVASDATSGTNVSGISFPEPEIHSTSKPEEEHPNLENIEKPISSPKSTHRSRLRFANLIAPFLRRFQRQE